MKEIHESNLRILTHLQWFTTIIMIVLSAMIMLGYRIGAFNTAQIPGFIIIIGALLFGLFHFYGAKEVIYSKHKYNGYNFSSWQINVLFQKNNALLNKFLENYKNEFSLNIGGHKVIASYDRNRKHIYFESESPIFKRNLYHTEPETEKKILLALEEYFKNT